MKLFHRLYQVKAQAFASTLITLLLLTALAVPAAADIVRWDLNNVTFLYGSFGNPSALVPGTSAGVANGWLQYDTTLGQITNWNISVPQVADSVPQITLGNYTPINPQPFTFTPTASVLGNTATASIYQTIANPSGVGYLNNYSTLTFTGFAMQQWNYQNWTLPVETIERNVLSFSVPLSVTFPYDPLTSPPQQNLTPLGTLPIVTNGPPGFPQGTLYSSITGFANGDPQINVNSYVATGQIVSASPVPLPGTLFLLASGFAGLFGLKRKYLG